jgi:hypothetical protein
VLVHVDQDKVVHQAFEPQLLRCIERDAHRRHPTDLRSEDELGGGHALSL